MRIFFYFELENCQNETVIIIARSLRNSRTGWRGVRCWAGKQQFFIIHFEDFLVQDFENITDNCVFGKKLKYL